MIDQKSLQSATRKKWIQIRFFGGRTKAWVETIFYAEKKNRRDNFACFRADQFS